MRDPMEVPTEKHAFRERLVARMRVVGITGAELARKAGLSKDAISTYTSMRSMPTPNTLDRLALALQCKPADLIPVKQVSESFIELRDSPVPGHKVLVAKLALPTAQAIKAFGELATLEKRIRNSRIEKT